jgi:hypothetical protein
LGAGMGPAKVEIDLAITGGARFCEAWPCEVKQEAGCAFNHAAFCAAFDCRGS